ncbi:hypothetical protein DPMN_135055 [Dreissena polymorpha]|uniref:Uncharacterized protein n=1 Tax=Dreissena polymorpha TaxID=45954 RepID=A0A9D4FYF9_DREPO|nr:hypothetical protein DPMN_135055 [Dreissena polymorpha]
MVWKSSDNPGDSVITSRVRSFRAGVFLSVLLPGLLIAVPFRTQQGRRTVAGQHLTG